MSEPADHKTLYFRRMRHAFSRFVPHETIPVELPVLKQVRFEVYETYDDPDDEIDGTDQDADDVKEVTVANANEDEEKVEEDVKEDTEFVITTFQRDCFLFTYPNKLIRLTIVLTDTMFQNKIFQPPVKTMEAKHVWIMNVEDAPHAPLKATSRQIMFDVARGGNLEIHGKADRIPARTYLGMPVTTNEELVRLIEALPDSYNILLDFSTV
jgi:hypothetical protein